MSFWYEKQEFPIVGLAPMHGFTKSDFRALCRANGADVTYTEMVASEAIIRSIDDAFQKINFTLAERPIIVQIFGANPESMAQAAQIIEEKFNPDGIDINFGCPVQKAAKQGFGAVQLSNKENAVKILKAMSEILTKTPISAKIRLVDQDIDNTLDFIRSIEPYIKVLAVHGRTATQKYRGEADWTQIWQIKKAFPDLLVLGNGDIRTLEDLKYKIGNLDGALIGRAAKINPQVFQELIRIKKGD